MLAERTVWGWVGRVVVLFDRAKARFLVISCALVSAAWEGGYRQTADFFF